MAFGTDTARAGGISSRGGGRGIGGGRFRASPTGRSKPPKPSSGGSVGSRKSGGISSRSRGRVRPSSPSRIGGSPTFTPTRTDGEFLIGFGRGQLPLQSHVNVQSGRAGPIIRVRRDDPRAIAANIQQAPPGTFNAFPTSKRKPKRGGGIRSR